MKRIFFQIARENGRFQIALNCLSGVKNLIGNIQKGGKYANLLVSIIYLDLRELN